MSRSSERQPSNTPDPTRLMEAKAPSAPLLRAYLTWTQPAHGESTRAWHRLSGRLDPAQGPSRPLRWSAALLGGLAAACLGLWLVAHGRDSGDERVEPRTAAGGSRATGAGLVPGGAGGSEGASGTEPGAGGTSGTGSGSGGRWPARVEAGDLG